MNHAMRRVRLGAPFNALNAKQKPVRQGAPYKNLE
jgi:hypothetical protein